MRRTLTGAVDGAQDDMVCMRSLGSDDPPGPAGGHILLKACPKPAIHAIVLGKAYFRLLHNRCELASVLGREATGPWC